MAFSKQELRKVTKEYHGREVKKGLDHLYKKVEKHLSDEENLLQVIKTIIISLLYLCVKFIANNINFWLFII